MKRLIHLIFLSFFCFLFSINVTAQNKKIDYVRCNTTEQHRELQFLYPGAHLNDEDFEKWMSHTQSEMKRNGDFFSGEISLPVVVHVIHDGDALGVDENISDAQIYSQMQVLNEDFGKMPASRGYNTHFDGADSRIEWCLAQVDPNGNPSTGINRVQMAGGPWTSNDFNATVKPATQWDPTQYCNIWIGVLDGGLLGYAQFPVGSGLPDMKTTALTSVTDGIVVTTDAFGSVDADDGTFFLNPTYNLGRTLTHEAGHWLGLRHIWGDATCGNDYCNDTPTQQDPSGGCPTTTTCDGVLDMVENYMDYSTDVCMNIFTLDQKARMDAVLANSPRRMELVNSNKCIPPTEVLFIEKSMSILEESDAFDNCNGYKDYTIEMRISAEPTADAILNFNFSGTAVFGEDFTLIPAALTFPENSASKRSFTLRVYDDAYEEVDETLEIAYNIATSGDAIAGSWNQVFQITLMDNDINPDPGVDEVVFSSEDFAGGIPSNWENIDNSGGGVWEYATAPPTGWNQGALGFDTEGNGYIMFDSDGQGDDNIVEDAQLITAAYDCRGVFDVNLNFDQVYCNLNTELTSVGVSTDGINYAFFPLNDNYPNSTCSNGNEAINVDISAIADNQPNVFIKFRYQGDWHYWWIIDDITLNGRKAADVQSEVNTSMPQEHYLGPNGTVHFFDPMDGNIMMTIENLSNFDYGCTSVEINRAGQASEQAWNPDPVEWIASKTFSVSPEFNNPSGNYKITLYYLEEEVAGWEAATGRSSNDLNIIKTNNDIRNPQAADVRTYALDAEVDFYGDYKYTATFFTGFSDFGIGPQDAISLPFDLVYFQGKKERDGIQLKWRSEREVESDFYLLERSLDGIVFETIATVNAVGSDENPADYDFLDRNYHYGYNYYRLRHVKLDGSVEFSPIINVKVAEVEETVNLFPNPVKEKTRLKINSLVEEGVNIKVINTLGQTLKSFPLALIAGNNYFDLDVSDLLTGVYFIQIEGGEQDQKTYKFLKN